MKYLLLFTLAFVVACSGSDKIPEERSIADTLQDSIASHQKVKVDSMVVKHHLYKNLSYTYNYNLSFYTNYTNREEYDHHWIIEVFDKKSGLKTDSIYQGIGMFSSEFQNFDEVRSYVTGVNKNKESSDNYYGDLVIADLNFDNLEDIIITNDIGGNGGTSYVYYTQNDSGKFIRDAFLTDSMLYFPTRIYPEKRMLLTLVHAGACCVGEHKYKLNNKGEWHQISHKILGEH
jgi:hypothetical protein